MNRVTEGEESDVSIQTKRKVRKSAIVVGPGLIATTFVYWVSHAVIKDQVCETIEVCERSKSSIYHLTLISREQAVDEK